jgi:hypothetical protein
MREKCQGRQKSRFNRYYMANPARHHADRGQPYAGECFGYPLDYLYMCGSLIAGLRRACLVLRLWLSTPPAWGRLETCSMMRAALLSRSLQLWLACGAGLVGKGRRAACTVADGWRHHGGGVIQLLLACAPRGNGAALGGLLPQAAPKLNKEALALWQLASASTVSVELAARA